MNCFRTAVSSLSAVFIFSICLLAPPPAQAQATGQWQFTGSFATGHGSVRLVQLADGRVLAASGGGTSNTLTASAEIYTPATGQWTSAGSLNIARYGFGSPSVLPDGRVLVATGDVADSVETNTAEIYNPATNSWSLTGSLNQGRRNDVQIELADGRVMVADGAAGGPTCGRFLNSTEIYDPVTGLWSPGPATLDSRESGTGIRLADGRVLLAGGYVCGDTEPALTELFDPITGTWAQAGNLPIGRVGGTLVMLADHRILMFGGHNNVIAGAQTEAAIFDPATNQWTEVAPMNLPRDGAAATLLPNGTVLVSQGGPLQSEIYDPATNTWTLDATTLDKNDAGGTFLLPTGKVLLAGGSTDINGIPSTTAELYTPAPSPCPQGTGANVRWHYTAGGSAGGWSATTTQHCPGTFSMGPQAMEGNLQVAPGATVQAGYDFTLPGNHKSLTLTVSAAQVTFAVSCVSGATPSASTFTLTMPSKTYQVTNDQWYPSGSQSSPLVYQGSVSVPDLCGGGALDLADGGTFTATLS